MDGLLNRRGNPGRFEHNPRSFSVCQLQNHLLGILFTRLYNGIRTECFGKLKPFPYGIDSDYTGVKALLSCAKIVNPIGPIPNMTIVSPV